jgi:tetratricopeptide (TPR) repeat protein
MVFSRNIYHLKLLALIFFWTAQGIGLSQSSDIPETQSQQEMTDVQKAREMYLKGDAADRAGNSQEAIRSYQEAAKLYQQVIGRNPGSADTWKSLGFVHWLSNRNDEALAAYKEAVRLRPDDANSHYMLGTIQMNDPETAIAEYRKAVRLNPVEAKYRFDLSLALLQRNELDASIAELKEVSRLNPKNGEPHALLGSALEVKGDIAGAISEYQKALTLDLSENLKEKVMTALRAALAKKEHKPDSNPKSSFIKLTEWKTAIDKHSPGKSDSSAVEIGSWPSGDLETVIGSLQPSDRFKPTPKKDSKSIMDVLGIKTDEDKNRILKRGALLHTDIALLELESAPGNIMDSKYALVKDGKSVLMDEGRHLEYARLLLDLVSPNPSKDEMARQWYVATTAYELSRGRRMNAENNLTRALNIFPSDPVLLFYAGALHENYASSGTQNTLPPLGAKFKHGSKQSELELARQFYLQAVTFNPDFPEARLRLGRVLGLLGNHEQAVAELQRAATAMKDRRFQYYASLFLGHEEAMLGRNAEARKQFRRALALYPNAQSAMLALGWMARSKGDIRNALLEVEHFFAAPAMDLVLDDPWWEYYSTYIHDAHELIEGMRKAFGGLLQ